MAQNDATTNKAVAAIGAIGAIVAAVIVAIGAIIAAQVGQGSQRPSATATPTAAARPAACKLSSPRIIASITDPTEDAVVPHEIDVRGTTSVIPAKHILVLMSKPSYSASYYPQTVQVHIDGTWTGHIVIGGFTEYRVKYLLQIYDIGPKGVIALNEYFRHRANQTIGIPEGELATKYAASLLDCIQLTRAGPQ